MCVQNLNIAALAVPEIGGTRKNWAIPGYSLFSKNFHGLLFGWTLWMYWPNLKSVAFPLPEIIGVPKNFGQSLEGALNLQDLKMTDHKKQWLENARPGKWRTSHNQQEAQLPQRNSASAVHVYLGWLTDRAMHRIPQNHRGCTISDIQTLWFKKCWPKTHFVMK